MKELIEDLKGEDMIIKQWMLYGLLLPLSIVAMCVVAEVINQL